MDGESSEQLEHASEIKMLFFSLPSFSKKQFFLRMRRKKRREKRILKVLGLNHLLPPKMRENGMQTVLLR